MWRHLLNFFKQKKKQRNFRNRLVAQIVQVTLNYLDSNVNQLEMQKVITFLFLKAFK